MKVLVSSPGVWVGWDFLPSSLLETNLTPLDVRFAASTKPPLPLPGIQDSAGSLFTAHF